MYRYRSPHLPPQNPLVGWDNPPAVVALGVDGETSRPHPTAPTQPAALSRHSRTQCPPSMPGRTRPALAPPVSPTPGASLAASTGPPRNSWAALLARVFARCDPLSRLWRTTAPGRRANRSRIHSAPSITPQATARRRRRTTSKSTYLPTLCIENPLFRPAGSSFVVHRLATP